jgi:hypothetical protein
MKTHSVSFMLAGGGAHWWHIVAECTSTFDDEGIANGPIRVFLFFLAIFLSV